MKVEKKSRHVVITLDLNEDGGDFGSEVQELRLMALVAAMPPKTAAVDPSTVKFAGDLYNAIVDAEKPSFDPKGGIRCAVDPKCRWTGKTSKRAGVHAVDRDDLQARGHLAQF